MLIQNLKNAEKDVEATLNRKVILIATLLHQGKLYVNTPGIRKETMRNYKDALNRQLIELMQLEKEAAMREKGFKGLEKGNIRVSKSNGYFQYRFKKEGENKEQYISKIDISRIQLLLQRDYDEKIHKHLKDMIKRLEKFNKSYDIDSIDTLYESLSDGRRNLINPIRPTKDMIIKEWYTRHPGNLNSHEKKHEFKTTRGECVRSKSEKILADFFHCNNIPYVCEPVIKLKNGRSKYPDFCLLNVNEYKTFYWEHLGKVDDEDYASRNFEKLMDYEESGLIIGQNLIVTMETRERPLDIKLVEKKVHQFLL